MRTNLDDHRHLRGAKTVGVRFHSRSRSSTLQRTASSFFVTLSVNGYEDLKSLPDHFTREVQVGIVLTPQTALEIGKWMIRHAKDILKLTEEIQDETGGTE